MAGISGDGVFSHATMGANDLAVSTPFYDAALGSIGRKEHGPFRRQCRTLW